MSRYRTIHCLIWNDDKFPFVSDDCQLVFFHVLTTPLSTPFGLFKASIEMLASEKRWTVSRYSKAFREGFGKGFFKHDEKAMVLFIPNFLKYNQPGNPNVLRSWGKQYNELPDSCLKEEFYCVLKAFAEGFGEAFAKAFKEAFRHPLAKGPVTVTDPDTVSVTASSEETPAEKFTLPDWIPADAWQEFQEIRRRKRAPLTDKISERLVSVLAELKNLGYDPRDVLYKAVNRNWTSIEVEWIHKPGSPNSQKEGQLSERTLRILNRGIS